VHTVDVCRHEAGRVSTVLIIAAISIVACGTRDSRPVLSFSGSSLGPEAAVVRRQLDRFAERHPDVRVELRVTPDAADQRHQLYVQWLNARSPAPDVLQLDVVWTAEFAAAGWILPLDRFAPDVTGFVPAALHASRWRGALYALPWFVDVGLLYWRTDLLPSAPASLTALERTARESLTRGETPLGLVWTGARYEGLITVFVEYLAAAGGGILADDGRVIVDEAAAVAALSRMRQEVGADGIVPISALNWREEEVRLAFQNGQSLFMRNWPYAWSLLQDPARSRVAGRVATAPFPGLDGHGPAAALGGAQLAVNAHSRQPQLAFALTEFLTAPEQMLERARLAAQLPARLSLYEDGTLEGLLPMPIAPVRQALNAAIPRPVTPVYSEMSEILQVSLHRSLTGQQPPAAALAEAAASLRALLRRSGLEAETGTR
jgi:ABC-type glycerol-3-phosphate transport system substrate-binding protein